jgi:hypothetical protein
MRTLSALIFACLPAAWSAAAVAQHSLYAGETTRVVKALSDQEIADYLAGKGMGYAKAAELNGYPGPAHVLDLAADLRLTPEQRVRTQQVFNSMQADATSVGRALVDRERELDASFAQKAVTPKSLAAADGDIASLQGRLRDIHLQAHLEQTAILTSEQIRKYDELRGYRERAAPKGQHHHGH